MAIMRPSGENARREWFNAAWVPSVLPWSGRASLPQRAGFARRNGPANANQNSANDAIAALAALRLNAQRGPQASQIQPTSVQRLPNGNTLVVGAGSTIAGVRTQQLSELDRNGQTVWTYKYPDGSQPWRARRR